MRKGLLIMLALLFTISLVGCQAATSEKAVQSGAIENGSGPNPPSQMTPVKGSKETIGSQRTKGITVNHIVYRQLKDSELSDIIKQTIEKHKTKRGYDYILDANGAYTLIVYSGQKSTGGYDIQIQSIEDNEGMTNVVVQETKPKQGTVVTTAFTYPYIAVTFTGSTDRFSIVNTDGEYFKQFK